MPTKILVPIDESVSVADIAKYLSLMSKGDYDQEVILLKAREPRSSFETASLLLADLLNLSKIAANFASIGIKVKCEIISGRWVVTILNYCKNNDIKLIIFQGQDRSAISAWASQKIRGKIACQHKIPMLIIPKSVID
jgi:hypothetical protein